MAIDPQSPTPASVQLAGLIRQQIATGELEPGKKIPPHKELAETHKIATQTVQNGLRLLREEGLLHSAGQRGTFVTEHALQRIEQRQERDGTGKDSGLAALRAEVRELRERVTQLEDRVGHG